MVRRGRGFLQVVKMSRKTHDVCIAVGKFQNARGEEKTQYRKIGSLMEGDNGPFLLMNAEVLNMPLFALANPTRRDSVILSLFEVDRQRASGPGEPPPYDDIPC